MKITMNLLENFEACFGARKIEIITQVEQATVKDIIIEMRNSHPKFEREINGDIDNLNTFHITVLRNNRIISMRTQLFDGDVIYLLPLITGG